MKDLTFIKEALLELDPSLSGCEETEDFCVALILLSSLVCGSDAPELAEFTQLALPFVTTIRKRMIAAELWSEATGCLPDWHTTDGSFRTAVFWADVLVARGLLVRRWMEEEGAYCYFTKERDPELRNTVRPN